MRLTQRRRQSAREKVPRVAISQAEITADLIYPASRRATLRPGAGAGAEGRRR